MKIAVSILSFIVLVLSTVPCYAYHEVKQTVDKQCDNKTNKCDDECNGNCSPFFSCGTCSGFVSNFSTPISTFKIVINNTSLVQPIFYNNPVHSTFFCKIWQPPKIV